MVAFATLLAAVLVGMSEAGFKCCRDISKEQNTNNILNLKPLLNLESICLQTCNQGNCSSADAAANFLGQLTGGVAGTLVDLINGPAQCLLNPNGDGSNPNGLTANQACLIPCILDLNVLNICDVQAIITSLVKICPSADVKSLCVSACACCGKDEDALDVCVNLCLSNKGIGLNIPPLLDDGRNKGGKMKLIIDTDMGVDDALALMLALSHPKVVTLAITTVFGIVDVEQAVANASRLRRLTKKENVPIYMGASGPIVAKKIGEGYPEYIQGKDALGGNPELHPPLEDADYSAAIPGKHASQAIIEIARSNPGCTLVCLGPLTNLALAIKLDKNLSDNLGHVYIMGGNIQAVGNVEVSYTAEFNFFLDPEAAHVVLTELKCPVTVFPWETHLNQKSSKEFETAYTNHQATAKGRFLHALQAFEMPSMEEFEEFGLCDEMAMAIAIDPSIIVHSQKRYYADVELHGTLTRGQVAFDYSNTSGLQPNVEFVTKLDMGKAEEMLLKSLEE